MPLTFNHMQLLLAYRDAEYIHRKVSIVPDYRVLVGANAVFRSSSKSSMFRGMPRGEKAFFGAKFSVDLSVLHSKN